MEGENPRLSDVPLLKSELNSNILNVDGRNWKQTRVSDYFHSSPYKAH